MSKAQMKVFTVQKQLRVGTRKRVVMQAYKRTEKIRKKITQNNVNNKRSETRTKVFTLLKELKTRKREL